jgi:hypothetical protein
MTLWDMFSLIRFICNKDFDGNIVTPDRFAELIKVVNIDLFRMKYGAPEQYQQDRPIPKEYADITQKNIDDLKQFKVYLENTAVVNGVLPYPEDYAHRDEIIYDFHKIIDGVDTSLPRGVEMLKESQLSTRRGNYTKRPTLLMPVAVERQDGIHIYPYIVSVLNPVIIEAVDFSYYRWPRDPVFAYIIADGYATYDAANSVELEWPMDEHLVLVRMILQYVGVNLREADIVNYSELKLKEG